MTWHSEIKHLFKATMDLTTFTQWILNISSPTGNTSLRGEKAQCADAWIFMGRGRGGAGPCLFCPPLLTPWGASQNTRGWVPRNCLAPSHFSQEGSAQRGWVTAQGGTACSGQGGAPAAASYLPAWSPSARPQSSSGKEGLLLCAQRRATARGAAGSVSRIGGCRRGGELPLEMG